jgi:hypothetical protein
MTTTARLQQVEGFDRPNRRVAVGRLLSHARQPRRGKAPWVRRVAR